MATQPSDPSQKTTAKKAAAKASDAKNSAAKKAAGKKATAKKAVSKKTVSKKTAASPPPSPPTPPPPPASSTGLTNLPIVLFGAALGLAGFAAAWRESAAVYGSGGVIATLTTGIALGVFAILVVLYALKAKQSPHAVLQDFKHPVTSNFFAVPTITLILLSSNLVDSMPQLALVLWAFGSIVNIAVTVAVLTYWIHRDCEISHAAPVWFIPIVGNLIIPSTAASLGYHGIGWMVLGFSLFFWIALFTIVLYRLLFSKPLEAHLKPTVAIFLAPPSLAFIDYVVLMGGEVDGAANMLMGICLFTLFFLLPRVPDLLRQPFSLAWWSYTFPLAAFAVACTLHADATGFAAMHALAICMMAILSVIVLIISAKTLHLVAKGRILLPPQAAMPHPSP